MDRRPRGRPSLFSANRINRFWAKKWGPCPSRKKTTRASKSLAPWDPLEAAWSPSENRKPTGSWTASDDNQSPSRWRRPRRNKGPKKRASWESSLGTSKASSKKSNLWKKWKTWRLPSSTPFSKSTGKRFTTFWTSSTTLARKSKGLWRKLWNPWTFEKQPTSKWW